MNTNPAQFRKKPVVVAAAQWFKNGDHPEDYSKTHDGLENGELRQFSPEERKANGWEGDVVRYYRHPADPGTRACQHCGKTMHVHGWIDTKEGGHIVCPGDWIITGVQGEHYPCKPDIFDATYEPVSAPTSHPIPTGATGEDGEKVYHFEQRSKFGPWIEVEKPTAKSVEFVKRSDATPAGDSQDLTLAQKYEDACIAANANARDAERYRWLRDPKIDPALVLDKRTGYVPEDESVPGIGGYHTYEYRAGEELDAAIDAAIAQQKGEA